MKPFTHAQFNHTRCADSRYHGAQMSLTFTGLCIQLAQGRENVCEDEIGMVCGTVVCVCFVPFWEMLDKSVMILFAFLLLEGAAVARGMAVGQNRKNNKHY